MAPPTVLNTLFWHWANQTYYAALNFGNRNATNFQSTLSIFMSYTAAAASSVFLAIFLRKIVGNYALKMRSGNQILFNSSTSFAALAGASVVNAIVMRS